MLRTDDHKPGICQLYLSLFLPLSSLSLSHSPSTSPSSSSFSHTSHFLFHRMIPTLLLIRVSPISDSYTLYFLSSSHPSHVSPVFLFYRAPRFLLHTVIFLSDSSLFRSSSQITMIDPRFSRWSLTSRALTLVDYGKHHEPDIYGW